MTCGITVFLSFYLTLGLTLLVERLLPLQLASKPLQTHLFHACCRR